MPTIPKPPHVSLPSHEIAKLHDYRKKWLEAVRVATVCSETTKHKFTTLPIALYATEPPQNADLDFSVFLSGGHTPVSLARKVLFYNGTVFHKSSKENEVLLVAGEDIFDVESPITQKFLSKTETTACILAGVAPNPQQASEHLWPLALNFTALWRVQ